MFQQVHLSRFSTVLLLIVCCIGCNDDCINLTGTWSRPMCDNDSTRVTYIFVDDELVEPGQYSLPLWTIWDCVVLPFNKSTYFLEEDYSSIKFNTWLPEDSNVIFMRPDTTIWTIDSLSDNYIRYYVRDDANNTDYDDVQELWRE